ncbi:MAG: hypothetical protein E5V75_33380, partial [Mesorhizobium sp.]
PPGKRENCHPSNRSILLPSIRFGQKLPISPLAGEMSGRTEGGVKERGATVPFLIPKIIAAAQAG